MPRATEHLEAQADRPFAAAQGDMVRQLRLMPIGRPKGRPYYGRRGLGSSVSLGLFGRRPGRLVCGGLVGLR